MAKTKTTKEMENATAVDSSKNSADNQTFKTF